MRLRMRITGYYSSSIIVTIIAIMGDSLSVFRKELEPEPELDLEEEPSISEEGKEGIIIITS